MLNLEHFKNAPLHSLSIDRRRESFCFDTRQDTSNGTTRKFYCSIWYTYQRKGSNLYSPQGIAHTLFLKTFLEKEKDLSDSKAVNSNLLARGNYEPFLHQQKHDCHGVLYNRLHQDVTRLLHLNTN